MPDPPDETRFDSERLHHGAARLPWWFWPTIVVIVAVFIWGMATK